MELAALLTMGVTLAVLATLALTRIAPDVILMAAMAFLVVSGILTPGEALAGFSNPGVMTIATLYVVAAGLKEKLGRYSGSRTSCWASQNNCARPSFACCYRRQV